MRTHKALFIILAVFFAGEFPRFGNAQQTQTIEDFSKEKTIGGFPSSWGTYLLQKGKAEKVYKIAEEAGKKFLRALDDQEISMPIFKEQGWQVTDLPKLKWKWRATQLPEGGREDSSATNDSACGVYVLFGSKISGSVLKYVWSSTLPVGHVWEKEAGKAYIIVMASGAGKLGQWQVAEARVAEDYKKYFKQDSARNPSGIGVLTDGNAVHKTAGCDYTDFEASQ